MNLKKWIILGAITCSGILLMARFTVKEKTQYSGEKIIVALRNVAHQTLLAAGDSTSTIPPIQKSGENEFQISFNTPITILPDSLVKSFVSSLDKYSDRENYLVEVKECLSNEIVYAYEMIGNLEESIIPCIGRSLPQNCYEINVLFQEKGLFYGKASMMIIISSLLFFAFISRTFFTQRSKVPSDKNEVEGIRLGNFLFKPLELQLIYQNEITQLTTKEAELLILFSENTNQIINREKLEKEVWENKGVIVGRSLDVFISKLRKKLNKDSSVKLINVHGVGYKLNIEVD